MDEKEETQGKAPRTNWDEGLGETCSSGKCCNFLRDGGGRPLAGLNLSSCSSDTGWKGRPAEENQQQKSSWWEPRAGKINTSAPSSSLWPQVFRKMIVKTRGLEGAA